MIDSVAGETAGFKGRSRGVGPRRSAAMRGRTSSTGPCAIRERVSAGQQLVEDQAQSIEVDAGVGWLRAGANRLQGLRGHVRERPSGQGRRRGAGVLGVGGQIEVEEHGLAVVGQQDVGRFEVAVDDSPFVGVCQAVGEPGTEPEDRLDVALPAQDLECGRPGRRRRHFALARPRGRSCGA